MIKENVYVRIDEMWQRLIEYIQNFSYKKAHTSKIDVTKQ